MYFMVDLKGTTGILIYICCIFLKKRFREEFSGTDGDRQEEAEEPMDDTQPEIEEQREREEAQESEAALEVEE